MFDFLKSLGNGIKGAVHSVENFVAPPKQAPQLHLPQAQVPKQQPQSKAPQIDYEGMLKLLNPTNVTKPLLGVTLGDIARQLPQQTSNVAHSLAGGAESVAKGAVQAPVKVGHIIAYPIIQQQMSDQLNKGNITYADYNQIVSKAASDAGLSANDSAGTTLRKIGGAVGGTALDVLGAGSIPGVGEGAGIGVKALQGALIGGGQGLANTAQQDKITGKDLLSNVGGGALLGAAIPTVLGLIGKGLSAGATAKATEAMQANPNLPNYVQQFNNFDDFYKSSPDISNLSKDDAQALFDVGQKTPIEVTAGNRVAGDLQSAAEQGDSGAKAQLAQIDPALAGQEMDPEAKAQLEQQLQDQGSKTRGFTESVQNSDEVSPEVQKSVSGTYNPITDKDVLANSQKLVDGDLGDATTQVQKELDVKAGTASKQAISDAIAVAKAQDALGTESGNDAATQIYNKLAEHGTASGQSVQAFSLLSNRTPEGLRNSATQALTKAGVDVSGDLQQQIVDATDAIANSDNDEDKLLNTQRLVKIVNDNTPRSTGQAALGIWRAGLLTGPETVAKVSVGTTGVQAPLDRISQIPASIADQIQSLFTGERTTTATPAGLGSGFARGLSAAGLKVSEGLDASDTGGFASDFGDNPGQTAYESTVQNIHAALSKPAFAATFDNSLNDQAMAAVKNAGLSGDEADSFVQDFVQNPSDDAVALATKDAQHATNQQSTFLGRAATSIQQIPVIGKILAPFARIPGAIGTTGIIDSTPLGIANEVYKQATGGGYDQRALSQAIGRATTGSAIAAIGYGLAKAGDLTLKAPSDPKERALWDAEGKQPNSIKVGGKWISLNAFGPAGITIGLGGAFGDALKKGQNAGQAAEQAIVSAGGLLADQPYLKGISGFGNALNDPTRYGQTFLNSTLGSIIPAASSQIARGTDNQERAYSVNPLDTLKGNVPILRESLAPQRDVFGSTLPGANPSGSVLGGILGTVNPFYPSSPRNTTDAPTLELQRIYDTLGSSGTPPIAQPSSSMSINGKNQKLSAAQVQQFVAGSGPLIHSAITNLLNNPQYQALPDDKKSDQIKDVIDAARQMQQTNQLGDQPKSISGEAKLALSNPSALGQSISSSEVSATNPKDRYTQALQQYQTDKQADKISAIQDISRQKSLAKLQVEVPYSQDVVDLYSLSKDQIASYVQSSPDGAAMLNQLLQLDGSLTKAGYTSKLLNSKGQLSLVKSTSTSSSSKAAKPYAAPLLKVSPGKAGTAPKIKLSKASKIKAPKLAKGRTVSIKA